MQQRRAQKAAVQRRAVTLTEQRWQPLRLRQQLLLPQRLRRRLALRRRPQTPHVSPPPLLLPLCRLPCQQLLYLPARWAMLRPAQCWL